MKRYVLTLASDPKLRETEKDMLNIAADIGMIEPLRHQGRQGEMVFRAHELVANALKSTLAEVGETGVVVERPDDVVNV